MRTGAHGDLLPLFLAEAHDRLERLQSLVAGDWSDERIRGIRRELHTLKGSSRMMGLTAIAELCHEAEEAVSQATCDDHAEVQGLIDRLSAAVERVEEGSIAAPSSTKTRLETNTATSAGQAASKPRSGGVRHVRVPLPVLDILAEHAVQIQLASRQAAATADALFELARRAEGGIAQDEPAQALAGLAAELRTTALKIDRGQRRFHTMAEANLEMLSALQIQQVQPFLLDMARHARELARALNKEVGVVVPPTRCRLDRRVMDAVSQSVLHLVRNAVDHGLEDPDSRAAAGKPRQGSIVISAEARAQRVRLEVADDGRGIDVEKVAAAAVSKGFLTRSEASQRSRDEILQLLFAAGFSTRVRTTEVSGRGVGLDAVEHAVRKAGGHVWLASEPGHGTRATIDLPSVKRGERLIVVSVGTRRAAIVASQVSGFRSIASSDCSPNGRVVDLARAFGCRPAATRTLISLTGPGQPSAILVDRVVDEEEALIRPWPASLGSVPFFEGYALLSAGRPVAVLEPRRLGDTQGTTTAVGSMTGEATEPHVLLVDDSRVTREMLERLLEGQGFRVTTASSGEQAFNTLQETRGIDCVVTDIEMPGLDGLALTQKIRGDAALAHLPVIVVSTRGGAADRLAGLDAGADAYLTKQRLDARELARLVRRLGSAG